MSAKTKEDIVKCAIKLLELADLSKIVNQTCVCVICEAGRAFVNACHTHAKATKKERK